jgi:hypothetical protein
MSAGSPRAKLAYCGDDMCALSIGQLGIHRQRQNAGLIVVGVREVLGLLSEMLVGLQERQRYWIIDAIC